MDLNLNLNIILFIPIDIRHRQLLLFIFYVGGGELRLVQEHVYNKCGEDQWCGE